MHLCGVFFAAVVSVTLTAAADWPAADRISASTKREISWWYGCPATADDPGVDGVIQWAKEH
eukprot:SAG25_NODE_8461_length_421_cov_0.618012_1_plen_61_part_10